MSNEFTGRLLIYHRLLNKYVKKSCSHKICSDKQFREEFDRTKVWKVLERTLKL